MALKEFILGTREGSDKILDERDFKFLNEALVNNKTLTSLSFQHLNISGYNIINLFQALTQIAKINSSLQSLIIIESKQCTFFRQIEKINLPPELNTTSLKWHVKANYFYIMGVCKNFSINMENYKLEVPLDIIIKITHFLEYSDVKMPIYDPQATLNSETEYKLIAEFSTLLHPEEKAEPHCNSAVKYELIAELSNLQQSETKGEYTSINEYPVIQHCSLLGQDLMHYEE